MVLERVDGVHEQVLDGEVLLLAPGTSDVLHLNVVATSLWEALAPRADLTEVSARLAAEYDVEAARVLQDLMTIVPTLLERGVVQEVP